MKVLVTGAFGWFGRTVVRACLARGDRVVGFDLPTAANRTRGRPLPADAAVAWGDVRDVEAVTRAAAGCDAVVQGAAVPYPYTELRPRRAHDVNVGGTRALLAALAGSGRRPVVVFPSSVAVYGPGRRSGPPRHTDEPLQPVDHYGRQKAEAEALVRASGLPSIVLRLGVAAEGAPPLGPLVLAALLAAAPDTRVEWIARVDVGAAVAAALRTPAARDRILHVGGGPSCQVRLADLVDAWFEAAGLGTVPQAAYGRTPYAVDWMDTTESERLLGYQRHTFAAFRADCRRRLRLAHPAGRAARPLAQATLRALARFRSR